MVDGVPTVRVVQLSACHNTPGDAPPDEPIKAVLFKWWWAKIAGEHHFPEPTPDISGEFSLADRIGRNVRDTMRMSESPLDKSARLIQHSLAHLFIRFIRESMM